MFQKTRAHGSGREKDSVRALIFLQPPAEFLAVNIRRRQSKPAVLLPEDFALRLRMAIHGLDKTPASFLMDLSHGFQAASAVKQEEVRASGVSQARTVDPDFGVIAHFGAE